MPDLAKFVELQTMRLEIETNLDDLKKQLAGMEREILEDFEKTGTSSTKVNGMTIYLNRQLWAGPKKEGEFATDEEYAVACKALVDSGLKVFVHPRFNTNTVSGWVREQEKLGQELPQAIKDALRVEEQFTIKTRKGA